MTKVKSQSMRIVACLLSVLIVFSALNIKLNAAVRLRDTTVDLYFLDDDLVSMIGNIPSTYKTSYSINPSGSSAGYRYYIIDGRYDIQVSADGVVTPKKESVTVITSTGSYVREQYYETQATIRVYSLADGSYADINVNTHNYASIYFDNRINEIARNIKSQYSTDAARIEAITRYVAENYDYNGRYSSALGMLLYGGGDCWASTSMIIRIAQACGYQAWSRNGNKDPGAGSGHMNALVQTSNGTLYECEAGFVGTKPRTYQFFERQSLFSYYYYYDNGVQKTCVYQYDGQTVPANLVIPSSIGGVPVCKIGKSFIGSTNLTSITIPNTVEIIEDYAFASSGITSLNIPASVTSIGYGIVANCTSLTSLTVASNNPNYLSSGNVIYSKDRTTLVAAPFVSSITIPNTVTNIQGYAFYYNTNITSVNIPSSVTSIGEGAFGNCSNLTNVTFNGGLRTLGGYVFAYSGIKSIALPSTITSVEDTVFYGMYNAYVSLPTSTAPTIVASQNQGNIIVRSPLTIFITQSATGFNASSWTHSNITYRRSSNPSTEVLQYPTATPAPTNTPVPTRTPVNTPVPTRTPTNTPVPTNTPATRPSEHIDGGVTSFVERLYTVAHGRTCDIGGRNYWVNSIIVNGKTGGEVARHFFFSPEFTNRSANMTNEEFMRIIYRTFFDREADQGGLNYYLDRMNNGMSKNDVINSFIDSQEWADLCLRYGIRSGSNKTPAIYIIPGSDVIAFVTRYYESFLGRQPDAGGLNTWSDQLANLRISGTELAIRFLNSPEFTNANYSNEEFLNRLYSGFMGRSADPSGYNYHLSRLYNGESRSTIISDFASSDEFRNICITYGILR